MLTVPLLNTVMYTYTGSILLCVVAMVTIAYMMRDILGGIVLAACVFYLYTL
jgi:hypothetical protein